ncbi:hypothetical protein CON35_30690 [Bacillus cereus]|nr:hypothetical protein CON35_30690 [Bacillus cereus]
MAGPQGPAGAQGVAGPAGAQGVIGPTGAQGAQGPAGSQGVPGPAGSQGIQGPTGLQGIAGPTGAQGIQGPAGAQGIQGPTGLQGIAGPTGAAGAQGVPGPAGPQGIQGPTGAQGVQGPVGAQGVSGPAGAQGIQGPTGPQGIAGATGAQGIPGPTGATGPLSTASNAQIDQNVDQTIAAGSPINFFETIIHGSDITHTNGSPSINLGPNSVYFVSAVIDAFVPAQTEATFQLQLNGAFVLGSNVRVTNLANTDLRLAQTTTAAVATGSGPNILTVVNASPSPIFVGLFSHVTIIKLS